jgi:hypothetical protein
MVVVTLSLVVCDVESMNKTRIILVWTGRLSKEYAYFLY